MDKVSFRKPEIELCTTGLGPVQRNILVESNIERVIQVFGHRVITPIASDEYPKKML